MTVDITGKRLFTVCGWLQACRHYQLSCQSLTAVICLQGYCSMRAKEKWSLRCWNSIRKTKQDALATLLLLVTLPLTPEIYQILSTPSPGAGNEIQLLMQSILLIKHACFCHWITEARYDVGDRFGFLKTSIGYALKHPQVKDDFEELPHPTWKELTENE